MRNTFIGNTAEQVNYCYKLRIVVVPDYCLPDQALIIACQVDILIGSYVLDFEMGS